MPGADPRRQRGALLRRVLGRLRAPGDGRGRRLGDGPDRAHGHDDHLADGRPRARARGHGGDRAGAACARADARLAARGRGPGSLGLAAPARARVHLVPRRRRRARRCPRDRRLAPGDGSVRDRRGDLGPLRGLPVGDRGSAAVVGCVLLVRDPHRGGGAALLAVPVAATTGVVGYLALNTALGGDLALSFVWLVFRPAFVLACYVMWACAPVAYAVGRWAKVPAPSAGPGPSSCSSPRWCWAAPRRPRRSARARTSRATTRSPPATSSRTTTRRRRTAAR